MDVTRILAMAGLFLTSIEYVYVLYKWEKYLPDSYADLTWFQVVIGVGYTLLWMRPIIPLEWWIDVCTAFFFASIPIILHSVFVHALRRHEANHIENNESR